MAPTAPLQDALFREMMGRFKQSDSTVPWAWNGYLYYARSEEGKDYAIICRRRDAGNAPEEILLDLNAVAGEYLALGWWKPSPNNRYLAYELDETGEELYTIFVLDMATGEIIDQLPQSDSFEWANDSRTLIYVSQRPEFPWRLAHFRHTLGEDAGSDGVLYEEPVAEFDLYTVASKDRAFIFLYSESIDSNEIRYVPADRPTATPALFAPRQPGVRSYLEHHEDEFLILTDADAPNFKVVAVPVAAPAPANWREIIPHDGETVLASIDVFERYIALFGREQGFNQVWIHDLASGETTPIPFDEAVYVVYPTMNLEFASTKLRLIYSSPVTPDTDIEYDMTSGERTILKQLEVIGGHDPHRYIAQRLFAPALDGALIPISLVALRDAPTGMPPGPRPLRLDGYGCYGVAQDPWFSLLQLTLIDRGITYAQAHVRGGGELGRAWWEAGRLLRKINSFTDFIACAEHLIREGYTAPDRLIAYGSSAGGLLVGGAATKRPDLFKAVIAHVPAADLIGGLARSANGPFNALEFGDPFDPAAYAYMRRYSPYENVRRQPYPMLLVTGGLHDQRVVYWEPAKWVAKLRHEMAGNNLVLLQMRMDSGHFGPSGRDDYLRESAFMYAFVLMALGMEDAQLTRASATAPHAARRPATA